MSPSTETLRKALLGGRHHRGYIVRDPSTGTLHARPAHLADLAALIASCSDYDGHRALFFEVGREGEHLLSACIHKTRRGQAAGGIRFWDYTSVEDFIVDGLRLSRAMGQKCALAGLWWGGGKGVIARRPDIDHRNPDLRAKIYRDYGRFLSSLGGCYVGAEDVGTTPQDMAHVYSTTRHTTCIPPEYGGSGNPSQPTAKGVVVAMEAALAHLGLGDLSGKTIAVQGLGYVSRFMIEELFKRDVKQIVGVDIDPQAVALAHEATPQGNLDTKCVDAKDRSIFAQRADIFVPNAVGGVLNEHTIPLLNARIVCGAANNPLKHPQTDAATLHKRGVLYVPDFLCNRMGIVNCANEQYGVLANDPAIAAHLDRETPHGIYQRSLEVFRRSAERGRPPQEEADALASRLSDELHPVWGDRADRIIDSIVHSDWAND